MAETFRWWLVVEGIGLLVLPLTFIVFRRLPDRGYAFAKPFGILLSAYLFWLALSLHVMPNRPGSIVWCFIVLGAFSVMILRQQRREILADFRARLPLIVAAELVFTLALFGGAHLRSYLPDISGTEKPMDFMFLNAASRSRYYPPNDAWLSRFGASYYYFGYVIQAMLGKLTAMQTAVAFNVALASTAALAATAAFGLGANLVAFSRKAKIEVAIGAGLAAAILLLVLGNLEGVLEFARANGFGSASFYKSMGIANLAEAKRSVHWYPTEQSSYWWWWRATRISPDANSITEFPFFSFLLGDLHPHVMAIPFVLTAVGIGLAFYHSAEVLTQYFWRARPGLLFVAGIFIGGLGFLNTWDLPTFGALLAVLVFARNRVAWREPREALMKSLGFFLPLAVVAVVAYLPFYLSFASQASGFAAVNNAATRPLHAALFWLPLVVLTLPVVLIRLAASDRAKTFARLNAALLAPVALLLLWALVLVIDKGSGALTHALTTRGWNWLTTIFFAGAFVTAAVAFWQESDRDESQESSLAPFLALVAIAYLLVVGTELFYIKDIFGSRLNTVFKLYYQAWIMLSIAGAYGGYWLLTQWLPFTAPATTETDPAPASSRPPPATTAGLRGAWAGLAVVVLLSALLYPLGATLSRTNGLKAKPRTLDGLAFARRSDLDDVSTADWLAKRAEPHEVIAEAVKTSYTDAARVSAWSGVPAVIGWPGHETQWGRDAKVLETRTQDINTAYTTDSLADALAILRKYGVTYVVVGALERATYPAAGLEKFGAGLDVASAAGQTTLYRVPVVEPEQNSKAPE